MNSEETEKTLKSVYDKHGHLTKENVLAEASNPKSPLHSLFEWDDAKAAHAHRLEQARRLIVASKFLVMVKDSKQPPIRVRAYIPAKREEGYRARAEVLSESELRVQYVDRKRNELLTWCKSVADISEFNRVRSAIVNELDAVDMAAEE